MTTAQHDINSPENLARRQHGQDVLSRIDGHQGAAVIDSLADINQPSATTSPRSPSVTSTTATASTPAVDSWSPWES